MMKEPRGRVRFLSDDEINNVRKAAEPDPVMYAAILVSLSTGLRQGELLRLTWADVDLTGAKVTVRESKNDEQRAAHLTATAVAAVRALRALPVVSPVHVFVLSDGTQLKKSLLEVRWNKIRTAAKLKDFRWHDLRHSCASILLQSGATLAQVGSVLGHKSPAMSLRYAHLVQGAPVTGHDKLDEKLKGK
jgi:integrase